ncbi:unnamed protein product [Auanema sp. JU1783]|nr:unnamed protein product [Auanema sp. JU1783]
MFLLLAVCILISSIAAAPVANTTQLTPEQLKKSLEPLIAFEKYFDEAYLTAIKTVFSSDRLLQQAADFINKMNENKIARPKTHEEAVRLLESEYPELGSVMRAVTNDYENRYQTLSADAKKFLDDIEKRAYQMSEEMSKASEQVKTTGNMTDPLGLVRTLSKLFLENFKQYQALDQNVLGELKQNWPKLNDFLNSNVFASLIRMVENTLSMSDTDLKEYISKFNAFL